LLDFIIVRDAYGIEVLEGEAGQLKSDAMLLCIPPGLFQIPNELHQAIPELAS